MNRPLAFTATRSSGEPEVKHLKNRARDPLSLNFQIALNEMIAEAKKTGNLQITDYFYIMCHDHFQTTTLNILSSQYDLKIIGGSPNDDTNPQFSAGYGIKGDGTTFRLDTGLDISLGNSHFTEADSSIFIWSETNDASLAFDVGISQGGNQVGIRCLTGPIMGGTTFDFIGGEAYIAPLEWKFGSTFPAAVPANTGAYYFNTINRRVYIEENTWRELGIVANGTFGTPSTLMTDSFMFADGQDPFDVYVEDPSVGAVGKEVLFWDGTRWYIGIINEVKENSWVISYKGSSAAPARAGIFPFTDTANSVLIGSGKGFLGWNRRGGSSTVDIWKSGVKNTISGIPTQGTPVGNMHLFGANKSTRSSKNRMTLICAGGGRTDEQALSLYNSWVKFLDAIGTIDQRDEEDSVIGGAWARADMAQVRNSLGVDFRVYQQIPPPRSDDQDNSTFAYFPATDFATMMTDSCVPEKTSQTLMRTHHWVWQMRKFIPFVPGMGGFPNTRPNYQFPQLGRPLTMSSTLTLLTVNGIRCWLQYSNETKAIAAVEVLFRYSLGYPATVPGSTSDPLLMGYLDAARLAGYEDSDILQYEYARENADTIYGPPGSYLQGVYRVATDKIILPDKRLVDAVNGTGMVLDSEAQDQRSPATLLTQLQTLAAICAHKNKEFLVYPNPLVNNGAIFTGFNIDNLWQIHQTPNLRLCITAEKTSLPIGDFLERQLNLLKGPLGDKLIDYSKLIMTVGIGTQDKSFNSSDTAIIHSFLQRGFGGVNFWRFYGQPSVLKSNYYNRVIAGVLGIS